LFATRAQSNKECTLCLVSSWQDFINFEIVLFHFKFVDVNDFYYVICCSTRAQSNEECTLCLRFFVAGFNLISKSSYSIFNQWNIKIDQVSKFQVCQFQMTNNLCFPNRINQVNRFQFSNYQIVY